MEGLFARLIKNSHLQEKIAFLPLYTRASPRILNVSLIKISIRVNKFIVGG
jgi:hypothetical protein